jgi:hypothetical protein
MRWRPMRGVRLLTAGLALALAAMNPAAGDDAEHPPSHGLLDGKRFVGMFGPAGQPGDKQDVLYFGDGQFWSAICVPCGFAPANYWIRRVGDAIHFRGEMGSPERGKFHYSGVIRGQHLTATINWRRERWYWSVDRDFTFEGTLSDIPVRESAATMTRRAVSAGPDFEPPAFCPL